MSRKKFDRAPSRAAAALPSRAAVAPPRATAAPPQAAAASSRNPTASYDDKSSDDETSDGSPSAARSHSPDASIIIQQIKKQIDQQSGQLFEHLFNRPFAKT